MTVNIVQFRQAMKSALTGPETKKMKIQDHEFNVKPIAVTNILDGIHINGREEAGDNEGGNHHISHHVPWWPDDQIGYRCDVTNDGRILNLAIDITTGTEVMIRWLTKIAKGLADAAKEGKADSDTSGNAVANGLPIPGTENLLDGSWEGEAKFLIVNIIIYAAVKHLSGINVRPRGYA